MIDKMVDGMIFPTIENKSREELEILKNFNFPFVLIMRRIYDLDTHYIGVDNEYGSRLMMSHLYNLGYREIGFIGGIKANSVSIERLKGYKSFIIEHGLSYRDELVEVGNFEYNDGFIAASKIIKNNPNIQAIFCANDYMALGAIDAAAKLNKKVPENLAIGGFDDMPSSGYSSINLTTIRIPFKDIIKKAINILIEELKGNIYNTKEVVIFKPKLIVRETCGYHKKVGTVTDSV
jgi:DNA-binding LacI/PurR family transcriptional regulator